MCASNPASLGAVTVFLLPPPSERHEHNVLPPRRFADAAAHFIAIHSWQADVEQHGIGTQPLGGFNRRQAVVHFVRFVASNL